MRYLANKKIGIIGLGNMGCAILKGLIENGAVKRNQLFGFDVDLKVRRNIKRKFRISVAKSIEGLSRNLDAIIIAVKPKDMHLVLDEIPPYERGKLFISIAAGIRTERIEKKLRRRASVVRVMPNTPALVGEGISAICKGRYATSSDMQIVKEIFSSVGECVELDERYFDLVTAISGSGPAYFFYLIEALIKAGGYLGLTKNIASKLVSQTALGSARLLIESKEGAGILRQRVTSKGGTTEAAINVFEKNRVKNIIAEAVRAAVKRSKELSGG